MLPLTLRVRLRSPFSSVKVCTCWAAAFCAARPPDSSASSPQRRPQPAPPAQSAPFCAGPKRCYPAHPSSTPLISSVWRPRSRCCSKHPARKTALCRFSSPADKPFKKFAPGVFFTNVKTNHDRAFLHFEGNFFIKTRAPRKRGSLFAAFYCAGSFV